MQKIEEVWLSLQCRAGHSFFLSWSWIENWLATLEKNDFPDLMVLLNNEEPISACFLSLRKEVQHKIVYRLRAYVNTTGNEELDTLVLEYNDAIGGHLASLLTGIVNSPEYNRVEELHLNLLTERAFSNLEVPKGYCIEESSAVPCYFVELEKIQDLDEDYLAQLSANQRRQIKQSLDYYTRNGDITIKEAADKQEACSMFNKLEQLHQNKWNSKGKKGAFSSAYFDKFHKRLIESRFDEGEIQLLEVTAGEECIGYLYNFVYNNQVLYYQSGFNFGENNKARPGIVSHYQAIIHNLKLGRETYNFLAGESQYKRNLATNHESLYTVSVTRNSVKSQVERTILGYGRKMRKWASGK